MTGGGADDDEVIGDRDQLIEGLGLQQPVESLVVFVVGDPALGEGGAQDGGHLLAVGVGGSQIPAGDGADIAGLGHAVSLFLQASWRR